MTGTQPIGQGEALEARARELLAAEVEQPAAVSIRLGGDPSVPAKSALRAITTALQPHIDHAVGGLRSEPVAWRTEYRDVYKGRDTGWRYVYHSNKPNPGQVTRDGCGHRNVTPLYATPPLDNKGLDAATRVHGPRNCTCHPDDQPPGGCRRKFASNECQADAAEYGLRGAIERIADVSERWENSLVSQINEIARAALSAPQQPVKQDAVREAARAFLINHTAMHEGAVMGCRSPSLEEWRAFAAALATPPLDNTVGLDPWKCSCAARSAEECVCGAWDVPIPAPDGSAGLDAGTVERCAKFIDDNVEVSNSTLDGRSLQKRRPGDAAGLAYSAGLRALASGDRS